MLKSYPLISILWLFFTFCEKAPETPVKIASPISGVDIETYINEPFFLNGEESFINDETGDFIYEWVLFSKPQGAVVTLTDGMHEEKF